MRSHPEVWGRRSTPKTEARPSSLGHLGIWVVSFPWHSLLGFLRARGGNSAPSAPLTEAGHPGHPRLCSAVPPQELPALLIAAIFHVIGSSTGATATPADSSLFQEKGTPAFRCPWRHPDRVSQRVWGQGGTSEEDWGMGCVGRVLEVGKRRRERVGISQIPPHSNLAVTAMEKAF